MLSSPLQKFSTFQRSMLMLSITHCTECPSYQVDIPYFPEWAPRHSLISKFLCPGAHLNPALTWDYFFGVLAIIMSSFDPAFTRNQALTWEPAFKRGSTAFAWTFTHDELVSIKPKNLYPLDHMVLQIRSVNGTGVNISKAHWAILEMGYIKHFIIIIIILLNT